MKKVYKGVEKEYIDHRGKTKKIRKAVPEFGQNFLKEHDKDGFEDSSDDFVVPIQKKKKKKVKKKKADKEDSLEVYMDSFDKIIPKELNVKSKKRVAFQCDPSSSSATDTSFSVHFLSPLASVKSTTLSETPKYNPEKIHTSVDMFEDSFSPKMNTDMPEIVNSSDGFTEKNSYQSYLKKSGSSLQKFSGEINTNMLTSTPTIGRASTTSILKSTDLNISLSKFSPVKTVLSELTNQTDSISSPPIEFCISTVPNLQKSSENPSEGLKSEITQSNKFLHEMPKISNISSQNVSEKNEHDNICRTKSTSKNNKYLTAYYNKDHSSLLLQSFHIRQNKAKNWKREIRKTFHKLSESFRSQYGSTEPLDQLENVHSLSSVNQKYSKTNLNLETLSNAADKNKISEDNAFKSSGSFVYLQKNVLPIVQLEKLMNLSIDHKHKLSSILAKHKSSESEKELHSTKRQVVLSEIDRSRNAVLSICEQSNPIPIVEAFSSRDLKIEKKIGEGIFGEVFSTLAPQKSVVKIIPLEGDFPVNGEPQKTFDELCAELVVSKLLSSLVFEQNCKNFPILEESICVYGKYTPQLMELWTKFDEEKGSENDCPSIFPEDQLYLILKLNNVGQDLETYSFQNASQAQSIFIQVALSLALAEEVYKFEHRDLHWGNILIKQTTEPSISFQISGVSCSVETKGLLATVIDYSLSRLEDNEKIYFNDLSKDPTLFAAEGDYQFQIYRLMRDHNKNNWEDFHPKTNIYWLHYLLQKLLHESVYKKKRKARFTEAEKAF